MARKNAAETTKDSLLEEFQALVSNTEKLLKNSESFAGEHAENLRSDIQKSLTRARESLKSAQENLCEQGKVAVEATEEYVGAHPWQAIGISAFVGLLLGLLLGRR